ncbi:FtsX-like permease family protein [Paenibacillus taiwanensis]|uniref:FtsX-like permease family protein n=1 Tax=Paenibacillus taiwanensis TaxID=401638 RepID=UPI001FE0921B|nr:ABC transporter permease [Paenibacillus taiwanensis]
MTTLTLRELVIRSMRSNMKHNYLYFFAFMMSTALYFVFATLANDSLIMAATFKDIEFVLLLKVSGILLVAIMIIFVIYANNVFLMRRSREIGLYQLVGLTRRSVGLLLITENVLLGMGALFIGITSGALVSRLFLLILLKLIDSKNVLTISFSSSAAIQTAIVFTILIALTLIQTLYKVYFTALIELLEGERQGDQPVRPRAVLSSMMGLLGIVLIVAAYLLSNQTLGPAFLLQILVILASIILGTYLVFRVTIGWLFYQIRRIKNGQLGLKNSLSLAPIMHRMKSNALSLTLITVLSAMTLTMVAIAYSLYYSAESEARAMLPYDFIFENNEHDANSFRAELESAGLTFVHQPIEAVRLTGRFGTGTEDRHSILLLAAEQLQASGADIVVPGQGEAIWYSGLRKLLSTERNFNFPQVAYLGTYGGYALINVSEGINRYMMNFNVQGSQLIVSEATLADIRQLIPIVPEQEIVHIDTYQIALMSDRAAASDYYERYIKADKYRPSFYAYYKDAHLKFGLTLFIAGFLGLVFMTATGSILYFKQMAEAEQERNCYTILRQLGFGEREMISGIIRKQLFVFAIPLVIGLVHSFFAVKTVSALTLSDISIPAAIAMTIYTLVYFVFAVLTVRYYSAFLNLKFIV